MSPATDTTTAPAARTAVVQARAVGRVYTTGAGDVVGCDRVDLTVHSGELAVVRGPSGSGKSTLLNLLGGLDRPDSGEVLLEGADLTGLDDDALAAIRLSTVGFVFQSFGLLPMLTAAENVEIPLRMRAVPAAERDQRVADALERVGLSEHSAQRPGELSGGQQQRVGIARAVVEAPRLLIADEPTGQLDSRTGETIMNLLVELVHQSATAAVVATHDPRMVEHADTTLTLVDGHAVDQGQV